MNKIRNVLLLYPKMPNTFWSMHYLNRITGFKSSYPPLGLMTIAPMLPGTWNKRLIDTNIEKLKPKDLASADLVFISAMNVQERSVAELVKICKDYRLPVVAGGPLFTHEYYKFPLIDYFVCNEAEITLPEFLEDFQQGKARRIYRSTQFADLSKTPSPDYNLIDLSKYNYSIIQFSRGCPYLCDFCDVTTLFGRVPRTKSTHQIIAELNAIMPRIKSELILFADDNLIGNKNVLKNDLLPALIQWRAENPYAPTFATQVSINLADDDDLMYLMLEAGFRHIFVGIETPIKESLEYCHKNQNLGRDIRSSINTLHSKGFVVTGGFIIGFDTDSEDIFEEMPHFIQNGGIVIATLNLLKAPPGTKLYDQMKQEGRLLESLDFDENKSNFKTKIPKNKLIKGYSHTIRNVYNPECIFNRTETFFSVYHSAQVKNRLRRNFRFSDIIIILRAIFYIGIINKHRQYFWKSLLKLRKYPSGNLVLAFLITVLSYQFQKMGERFEKQLKEDPYYTINEEENIEK